jgi:hypothetical protein
VAGPQSGIPQGRHRLLSLATCSAQSSRRFAKESRHVMGINEITYEIRGAVFRINPGVFSVLLKRYLKAEIRQMVFDLPEGQVA